MQGEWAKPQAPFNPKKVISIPALKRKREDVPISERVKLDRILGFTISSNAALDCDPRTGSIIHPAGCVIVLYNPRKNKQTHIINGSKKTVTCLAISPDGRYIASGECGHLPNVRVWDVQEKCQVAEFVGHKFGINCVAFSPNLKYVVSVGSQHDMIVNVWNWRSNVKVASNKVSSKVKAVAFAENGSYFVTVGNRHVKFWYLEYSRTAKYKEPVPLMGRSAILGEQRNNYFCDVACGKGDMGDSTFSITKSGLLCEFNNRRLLDKWVELRTCTANCLVVGEHSIFIGCAEGIVRCFSPYTLEFITTLPRPHYLGVDVAKGLTISHMGTHPANAKYPDTIAVTYDEANRKVTCCYNDHSMYVWDVRDIKKVGKSHSFLYHSACIWGIDTYPDVASTMGTKPVIPEGTFLTCSSDDTVRIWNIDPNMTVDTAFKRNIYSSDLLKIMYIDENLTYLCDTDNSSGSREKMDSTYDGRNGVRCIRISPDGKHLASGDRSGNIRIHETEYMDEICKIEAHDAEVLCLEYSKPNSDHKFLASASRDRLIHVFDVKQDYTFLQTLDDHSSSITAVRFVQVKGQIQMISCGADKSIIFRTAQLSPQIQFLRDQHIVGKTTLYDMEIDADQKHVLTACQDRNIRAYNVSNGKHSKTFKASLREDGTLIKIVLDNSGSYVATSCTDKNLCIYDFNSGDCVATMHGHSEIVTGLRFTNDCKHLVSVSGDGCIFIWKLPTELTHSMHVRMSQLGILRRGGCVSPRRQTFVVPQNPPSKGYDPPPVEMRTPLTNGGGSGVESPHYRFSMGPLPTWAVKQITQDDRVKENDKQSGSAQPKGRWAQRIDGQPLTVRSIYDSDHVIPYPPRHEESAPNSSDSSLTEADLSKFTKYRKENKDQEDEDFEICTESLNQILTENREEVPNDGFRRDFLAQSPRTRHLTDSSSISGSNVQDFDHEDDEESNETDASTEIQEVIYYPPSEDGTEPADSEYKVCESNPEELREAHRRLRKSRFSRHEMVSAHVQGTTGAADTDDEEDTSHSGDRNNALNMFSVSTESLDRVGQREQFLKSNFESLEGSNEQLLDDSGEMNDSRRSISAKYLSTHQSPTSAPPPPGRSASSASSHNDGDSGSSKKQQLMKKIEETRRKLETIGYKASSYSKSTLDLTDIPEKDTGYRGYNSLHKESDNSDAIRRSASLTDLSSKPRRLLPSPPNNVSGKINNTKSSPRLGTLSRNGSTTFLTPISRSSSIGTINQQSALEKSGSVSSLSRPTISSMNKKVAVPDQTRLVRSALPKSASGSNLSVKALSQNGLNRTGDRRVSESSSGDVSPTDMRPSSGKQSRQRSTSVDRMRSSRLTTTTSASLTRGTQQQHEDRLSKEADRDESPDRVLMGQSARTTVTQETVVRRSISTTQRSTILLNGSKPLEKSPQELPVKDTRPDDVSCAPLSRRLCEITAEDLNLASDNMVQLFKRITMDTELLDSERLELLRILTQSSNQSMQTLRPILPEAIAPSGGIDPVSLLAGKGPAGLLPPPQPGSADPMSLLQQYSDMLLNIVQQRMTAPNAQ